MVAGSHSARISLEKVTEQAAALAVRDGEDTETEIDDIDRPSIVEVPPALHISRQRQPPRRRCMAFSTPVVEITSRGFDSPHPQPGYLDDLVAEMEAVSGPVDESMVPEMTARYFKRSSMPECS